MTTNVSRRKFLSNTALVAGAVATTAFTSTASATKSPAYRPAAGVAKLNANENPYGPSPAALKAMTEASASGAYYVGDSVSTLISMIAERHGIQDNQITLSSGSSGVLTYLAVAKSREGKILGPDLFWDTTSKAAVRQGGEMKRIAKTADLSIDLDALYDAITPDVAMVQVCNPNNPTGMVVDPDELKDFIIKASKKCTVLVDEAYNEITSNPDKHSMVPLVKAGHDVLVARTFSKIYGLAGMRVGYMIASEENSELIRTYGLGNYAMNQAGVAAAVACFNDFDFLNTCKTRIIEARGIIMDAVEINGLSAAPSETSFVFVDLGDLNAEAFRAEMAKHKVLIRGIYQDYTNWSRVSCGLIEDVQQYAVAMPKALDALNA